MTNPDRLTHAQTCAICKQPRLISWSGQWTPIERLFLIHLLARIQREEKFFGKDRNIVEGWKGASADCDWMMVITNSAAEHITIADLIVETIVKLDPDIELDKILNGIERRFAQ